jgi:hypothetical protein
METGISTRIVPLIARANLVFFRSCTKPLAFDAFEGLRSLTNEECMDSLDYGIFVSFLRKPSLGHTNRILYRISIATGWPHHIYRGREMRKTRIREHAPGLFDPDESSVISIQLRRLLAYTVE